MKAGEGLEAEIKAVGKKYHEATAPEMVNFSNGLPYERKVSDFLSEHWSILIFYACNIIIVFVIRVFTSLLN